MSKGLLQLEHMHKLQILCSLPPSPPVLIGSLLGTYKLISLKVVCFVFAAAAIAIDCTHELHFYQPHIHSLM